MGLAVSHAEPDFLDAVRLSPLAAPGPYRARSASGRTEEWPFWYVCGADGRHNVLSFGEPFAGSVLTTRAGAEMAAAKFNKT